MRLGQMGLAALALLGSASMAEAQPGGPWAGPYLGGGLTFERAEVTFPEGEVAGEVNGTPIEPGTVATSVAGHVIGGFRFQFGGIAFGLEGDLQFGPGARWVEVETCSPAPCGVAGIVGSFDTFGHARAVLGHAIGDRVLAFGAVGAAFATAEFVGGYAFIDIGGPTSNGDFSYPDPVRETLIGLSLGGGVEVQATAHIGIRLEVLHDRYPSIDVGFAGTGANVSSGNNSGNATVEPNGPAIYRSTALRLSLLLSF